MKSNRLIELTVKNHMRIIKRALEKNALYDKILNAYPELFQDSLKTIALDSRDLLGYMIETITGEHPNKDMVHREMQEKTRQRMRESWVERKKRLSPEFKHDDII